ncbi:MAG: aspartyl/asparaginyl beta-hydroxylase domain-containing protein [Ferruginibacter sp.]
MIKYVQIKQCFDVQQMQQEVQGLQQALWKPHYNEKQYEGSWTTLPLRSINGSVENSISIHASSLQKNMAYKDTSLLNECPYLQSVITFFDCEKMSVRLMNLEAGAFIKEHTDHEMCFEEGEARFHIPISSNNGIEFFIEGEKIPMKEGECWYLNLSLKHHVINLGNTSRIHLVIDCKVNDWIKNLLMTDVELMQVIPGNIGDDSYSAADKIRIIRELRQMGTTVSIELADKMEAG